MSTTVLSRAAEATLPFERSETKGNLLRAFAGETQAKERYEFAASRAEKEGSALLARVFRYTAQQELAHARIFYGRLQQETAGETIRIEGSYPVDGEGTLLDLLKDAYHHEFTEFQRVYPDFAKKAEEEGYFDIAERFRAIAQIEQSHGERFALLARLIEKEQLFREGSETAWICLNCGYCHFGTEAPAVCPVCDHNRGHYVRRSLAPYTR